MIAYVRENGSERALVVLNNGAAGTKLSIPVSGFFAEGVVLSDSLGSGTSGTVASGKLRIKVKPMSSLILVRS